MFRRTGASSIRLLLNSNLPALLFSLSRLPVHAPVGALQRGFEQPETKIDFMTDRKQAPRQNLQISTVAGRIVRPLAAHPSPAACYEKNGRIRISLIYNIRCM